MSSLHEWLYNEGLEWYKAMYDGAKNNRQ